MVLETWIFAIIVHICITMIFFPHCLIGCGAVDFVWIVGLVCGQQITLVGEKTPPGLGENPSGRFFHHRGGGVHLIWVFWGGGFTTEGVFF